MSESSEEVFLALLPHGRDGPVAAAVLGRAGISIRLVSDIAELAEAVAKECAGVLVSQEALAGGGLEVLSASLTEQPVWSDLPVLVFTTATLEGGRFASQLGLRGKLGNHMLLERPLHAQTLVSAVHSALRARRRQLQVRDHLSEREFAAEELAAAYRQLSMIADSLPGLVAHLDSQLRFRFINAAALSWFGLNPRTLIGRSLREVIGRKVYARTAPHFAAALAGDAVVFETSEAGKDRRDMQVTLVPDRDAGGAVQGAYAFMRDVTETKRSEDRQKMLVAELDHRVKNALATVQSIAVTSLAEDPQSKSFLGRLSAMAHAHTILSAEQWRGVQLKKLLEDLLTAQNQSGRLHLEGPAIRLGPKLAQCLALVINELSTNASKYGALSGDSGQVEVSWEVYGQPRRLQLTWIERGGPRVDAPAKRGFGTTMIEQSLGYEFGADVLFEFDPRGVRFETTLPLGDAEENRGDVGAGMRQT